MVGARFRLQGHDPATGLDCVGVVWAAYAAAEVRLMRPDDYPLRGWGRGRVEMALVAAGFASVADARDGDVALIALPAGQFHLGLIGPVSLIHAHAGLRRVVETPWGDGLGSTERWRFWDGDRACHSRHAELVSASMT
ncbi:MAG: peptidoglycan endopeptidase [Sphingopyxis sp.]|nr:peptidoglycan endopeptidase [Sphingopyxis sp.]